MKIDAYRRNLQRAYLDIANDKLNGTPPRLPAFLFTPPSGDERPFYRAELKTLSASIGAAIAKTPDQETRAHLESSRDEIARILDPRFAPATENGNRAVRVIGDQLAPFLTPADQLDTCWPDYVIRP